MPAIELLSALPDGIEIRGIGKAAQRLSSSSPIPANWTDAKAETAAATWLTGQTGDDWYVHIYTRSPLRVATLCQRAGATPPPANWWELP